MEHLPFRQFANLSIARMISIMQVMGEDSEVARTRVQVLSDFLN